MNLEEAALYLEHTSKDDFNLEEHQKENRYQAIQVVLKEIERLQDMDKILRNENINLKLRINKAIEYINNKIVLSTIFSDNGTYCYLNYKDLLDILQGSDK